MWRAGLRIALVTAVWAFQLPAKADWVGDVRDFARLTDRGAVTEAAQVADRLMRYRPDQMPLDAAEREGLIRQAAETMAAAGRLPRAAELYQRLVEAIESREGTGSFALLEPLRRLGEIKTRQGDLDAAAALYDRALALAQTEAGEAGALLQPILAALRDVDQRRLKKIGKDQNAGADLRRRIARSDDLLETVVAVQSARAKALRSAPPVEAVRRRGDADEPAFQLVRIFYGANREVTGRPEPENFFADGRGPLKFGIATVSVPKDRKPGEIPLPSIWRGDMRPNAAKHFIFATLDVSPSADAFAQSAHDDIARSQRREAFVFIHGYNTDFQGAVFRAAQLAVDLEVDGATFLYSWPSKGSVIGYVADSAQLIRPVARDLESFLRLVIDKTGAEHINIAAHSMGNRYLLEALDMLSRDTPAGKRSPIFREIVFAAPDVDADDFSDRVSSLGWMAQRMTLYASSKDRALYLSSIVNGGYRRAGDASAIVTVNGLDTIDTTQVGGEGLGHGDFATAALDDFKAVMWLSLRPRARCDLVDRTLPAGAIYWMLADQDAQTCPPEQFRTALSLLRQLGAADALKYVSDKIDAARAAADSAALDRYQSVLSLVQKLK